MRTPIPARVMMALACLNAGWRIPRSTSHVQLAVRGTRFQLRGCRWRRRRKISRGRGRPAGNAVLAADSSAAQRCMWLHGGSSARKMIRKCQMICTNFPCGCESLVVRRSYLHPAVAEGDTRIFRRRPPSTRIRKGSRFYVSLPLLYFLHSTKLTLLRLCRAQAWSQDRSLQACHPSIATLFQTFVAWSLSGLDQAQQNHWQ